MKVLKFGGTSVGTVESLRNVKAIVESIESPTIVVVSALGGLTDKLIATAQLAAAGDTTYKENLDAISERHFNIISELIPSQKKVDVINIVSSLLDELQRNYDGVYLLRDLPVKTLDTIVSFGERMSSVIVGALINDAKTYDSLSFVKTEKWFSRNIVDQKLTAELIRQTFKNLSNKAIVPGFISTDRDSMEITNLGRGGSDFTAALIAAALNAEILEIWTDVDGFMTADPRIIPNAKVMPLLSFVESMELCTFGAKVIYPPTIYPVFHQNIPIKILNTFNPSAPGTLISERRESDSFNPKGISALKNSTLYSVSITGKENIGDLDMRTLNAMTKNGVTVFRVNPAEESNSVSFAVSSQDANVVDDILSSEFAPEISSDSSLTISRTDNLASLAVVGDNIKLEHRLSARIKSSLERNGIPVFATSEQVSDTTISYIISINDVDKALLIVHSLIFN